MNEAGVGVGAGYFQCMNFSKKNPLPKCTTSFHRTFYTTYIKKTRKGDVIDTRNYVITTKALSTLLMGKRRT